MLFCMTYTLNVFQCVILTSVLCKFMSISAQRIKTTADHYCHSWYYWKGEGPGTVLLSYIIFVQRIQSITYTL